MIFKEINKYIKTHGFICFFKKSIKMVFFIKKATFWYRNLMDPIESNFPDNSVYFTSADIEDIKKLKVVWPIERGLQSEDILNTTIKNRFDQEIPCFLLKSRETEEIFGAIWCKPYIHDIPLLNNRLIPRNQSFEINNLFISKNARGMGLSTQLLNYAMIRMRDDKNMIVSYSRIYSDNKSSMFVHKKVGFVKYGYHKIGYRLGNKINTVIKRG